MSNPINISDPEITFTAEEFDIPAFVKDCTRASNPEYRGNNVYGEAHRHLSTMRWFLSSNHRVDNNQIHFSLDKGRPALTVRDFRAIVSVLSQYAHTPKRFETNVSSGEDNEKMVYGWKNPSHPFINDETWEAKSRQSLNLHFAHRLLREVTAWVDSHFNFIPLGVAEKMATTENGNTLHEYIRQPEITEEDLAKYDLLESYREAEADDPGEYMQEYAPDAYHEKMDSNYPMQMRDLSYLKTCLALMGLCWALPGVGTLSTGNTGSRCILRSIHPTTKSSTRCMRVLTIRWCERGK
jgi:hypothetical protein